jgi:hypothetical protein
MILRTDTIGHFENPTEINIKSAISHPGENASENDLVKLVIDAENYLCVWIGKEKKGHTLELRIKSVKATCKKRFDSENSIRLMIRYLGGDITWVNEYSWEKSASQRLMESIQLLRRNSKFGRH